MTGEHPSVAVVIPAFNRSAVLRRTLAALEAQQYPSDRLTVVVADDGSEENLESIVDGWNPAFRKHYLRQERDGFGAGRARNLGASSVDASVLVFLDSDGLVPPDFIARHAAWHRDGVDRAVIGGRVHLRETVVDEEDLASGAIDLDTLPQQDRVDFRRVLSRRTSGYQRTDEGYRAFVSANVSLPRRLFLEVGGFDARFRWWGGEDTELGWRLWQQGADFVDDPELCIYHQAELDTAGGHTGRSSDRERNRGLLVSLIPQRFYRKGMPDPLPEVPKFSVLVHDLTPNAPPDIWRSLRTQTLPDFEVLFIGSARDHDPFAGAAEGDPRIGFVSDMHDAIRISRGEHVILLNGHGTLRRTALQNLAQRLDRRPSIDSLSVGIEVLDPPAIHGRIDDLTHLQESWQVDLPLVLALRRRALMRALRGGADLVDTVSAIESSEVHQHLRLPLAAFPSASRSNRPRDFRLAKSGLAELWEEARLGPTQAFRAAVVMARRRLRPPRQHRTPSRGTPPRTPGIRYVGWVGKGNLGDEAMLDATRRLLMWGDLSTRGEATDLLLLGGGTLINRGQYLRWLTERDSPRIERAALGTGVASPEFWEQTEERSEWLRWLASCAYLGVRGPRSAELLADWGYRGDLEVCGDPALTLEPSTETTPDGIVVAPAWTDGELWGGSDEAVLAELAAAIRRWSAEGHSITLMSSHPSDDRPIILVREMLGTVPTRYHAGYLDVEKSLDLIAAAEVVVGQRLHSCVLAAAAGRPFVGIEYRPKVRDFARSVEWDRFVVRSDVISAPRLHEMLDAALAADREPMLKAVTEYRRRLSVASVRLREAVS